ncbi:methionine aminopeptidase [Janibacter massiliensis]|uniref:methionine aminopeptidase n=1 Tax=Janibacter massiliensis TaxID=2058291 RepID=UPI002D768564|nr:methionine aminopeptidase [Janibacter massiliensis]
MSLAERPAAPGGPEETSEDTVNYWYDINTGTVETDDTKGPSDDLMGPYGSEAEARNALATARARTEKWDEEDRAWRGDTDEETPA